MDSYRGEPAFNVQGVLAMLATLLIWVGFLLTLRAEGQSALTSTDLALMRFGLPALLFLPLLLRRRAQLATINRGYAAMILLGGLPFFYLISLGSGYAPAAHAGALVPGTAPLFVTGLAVLVFKEPLPRKRLLGLGVILLGVLVLLGGGLLEWQQGYWRGHLAFLGASLLWACYTLGLRVIGIGVLEATALLCCGSLLGLGLLLSLGLVESHLGQGLLLSLGLLESSVRGAISWEQLWPFLLAQGLGAGVIGGFTYGIAIRRLGAEKTAALGSFTPALAALAAIPLLGETLSLSGLIGVLVIMLGVVLASGLRWRRPVRMVSAAR
ncbi:MAG: drug/metabolite transporter (DMT)-like permease [Motiliproteus sp.]|jgi:drug/metabolite transporter (DMT)-like permease